MEPKSIQSYVNKFRAEQFGNWESSIRNPPLSTVSDSNTRDFFLFRTEANLPTSKKRTIILGWGHPDFVFECWGNCLNVFVDCTFKVVPIGFYQLMIVMIFIPAYDRYDP